MSINSKVAFWEQKSVPKAAKGTENPRSPLKQKRRSMTKTNTSNTTSPTSPEEVIVDASSGPPKKKRPSATKKHNNEAPEKSDNIGQTAAPSLNSAQTDNSTGEDKTMNAEKSKSADTVNNNGVDSRNDENKTTTKEKGSIAERMKMLQSANVNVSALKPGAKPTVKKLDKTGAENDGAKTPTINLAAFKPGASLPSHLIKKQAQSGTIEPNNVKFERPVIPAGFRREKSHVAEGLLPDEVVGDEPFAGHSDENVNENKDNEEEPAVLKQEEKEDEEEIKETENKKELIEDNTKKQEISDDLHETVAPDQTTLANQNQNGSNEENSSSHLIEKDHVVVELEGVLRNHFQIDKTQIVPEKQVLLFFRDRFPEINLSIQKLDILNEDKELEHEKNPNKFHAPLDETAFAFDMTKWKVHLLDDAMRNVFGEEIKHQWGYSIRLVEPNNAKFDKQ